MKKFLALVTAIVMLFVMAIPAAAVDPINYTAPSGTPTLDGVKDDFYGEWIPINTIHSFDDVTTTGATGKFAFAWDATALYVIVEVIDTTPNYEHNNAHERDSVEVFIDWYNTGADHADNDEGPYWLVRISGNPDADPSVGGFTNDYPDIRGGWWGVDFDSDVLDTMTRAIASLNGSYNNGYIVETKIPIASVSGGIDFKAGTVIRFCLAINDNQGDGRATGAYPAHNDPDSSWDKPANHGYLMNLGAAPETGGGNGDEGGEEPVVIAPPKTGDTGMIVLAVMMILSAGVVVLRKKAVK